VMDQRHQGVQRLLVALAPRSQQDGDLVVQTVRILSIRHDRFGRHFPPIRLNARRERRAMSRETRASVTSTVRAWRATDGSPGIYGSFMGVIARRRVSGEDFNSVKALGRKRAQHARTIRLHSPCSSCFDNRANARPET
jgi:hypothetical protein